MKLASVAAAAVVSIAMTASASAGWIDDYNATLNTPAARAKLVAQTCASSVPQDFVNCGYYKANGAPISDVRYAIVAGSIIVGGIAGGALHAHPGWIGQKHLHILGWHPTAVQAIAVGAGTGYVVGRAATSH
ncbi:hypothetical protein [Prosthecodimorpha staleyi]|uniref:Uncharacterized protein n=1 Tax=Prosthecodimorpha staleyi TaxID=2840188 RepID=A0A947D7C0_9HYPH|nr:hypothetical protein [Prosthecodimorpha staleyi]MBT9291698.1 hypothetical protein [Prosthecodimorpha staleyi]